MADPAVPADRVVALDALRDRQHNPHLAVTESPMGRARALRDATARRTEAEGAAAMVRVFGLVLAGEDDAADEVLDGMPADLVSELAVAADDLAGLARDRAAGRRS